MSEKYEPEKVPQKLHACPAVGSQVAKVCLPVSVKPFAVAGPAKIQCLGEAVVVHCCDHCHGKINGTCDFTISQKIRVEVPVEFGAAVEIGETFVECECEKDDDHDCECKDEEKE